MLVLPRNWWWNFAPGPTFPPSVTLRYQRRPKLKSEIQAGKFTPLRRNRTRDAVLESERAHARPLARVCERVGSAGGCELDDDWRWGCCFVHRVADALVVVIGSGKFYEVCPVFCTLQLHFAKPSGRLLDANYL